MQILKVVLILVEVLLLFNLLIFVHELGHFLAARWRGLKVERFAVWFGRPIWKKKFNGVEYVLGCIPAGGYVSLPQMAPMEVIEGKGDGKTEELPAISPLDKIIVAVAGPLFSLLLAVCFALIVWMVGRPVNEGDKTTTVGWVEPAGPAWKAGLRPGDQILEVDGHRVTEFISASQDSIKWRVITSEGTNVPIKYLRNGEERLAYPSVYRPAHKWYERKSMRQLSIAPASDSIILEVITNSPADLAGLRTGDRVTALNGEKIWHPEAVAHAGELMTNAGAKPVALTVERGAQVLQVPLLAEKPLKPADSKPSFGILSWQNDVTTTLVHPGPIEQIRASVGQIVGTLRTLISRKSDVGVQQLGGAVMIIRVYKNLFESKDGWRLVLWFSVVMNVNLALLNMLPLPVLDGGHITLAIVEVIRRRPINARVLGFVQSAFAILLIGFMIFIAFYDTGDWVRSARSPREEKVIFAPKN